MSDSESLDEELTISDGIFVALGAVQGVPKGDDEPISEYLNRLAHTYQSQLKGEGYRA